MDIENSDNANFSMEEAVSQAKKLVAQASGDHRTQFGTDFYERFAMPGRITPTAFIFTSRGIDRGCITLLETLRTHNGELPPPSDQVRDLETRFKILAFRVAGEDDSAQAEACQRILMGLADETEGFSVYEDSARNYPQYANHWIKHLTRQFGISIGDIPSLVASHRELFGILAGTRELAKIHDYGPQVDLETVIESLQRRMEASRELGFEVVDKLSNYPRNPKLEEYRKEVYRLRGLEYNWRSLN